MLEPNERFSQCDSSQCFFRCSSIIVHPSTIVRSRVTAINQVGLCESVSRWIEHSPEALLARVFRKFERLPQDGFIEIEHVSAEAPCLLDIYKGVVIKSLDSLVNKNDIDLLDSAYRYIPLTPQIHEKAT